MVIQITPHTEQTQASAASQGNTGAGESHKAKSAQSSKIGVFAKILAGLSGKGSLHKTGTGDAAGAASLKAAGKVPLAETAQSGNKALIAGEKGKVRTQNAALTAAEQINAKKPSREPQHELSEQEKNALLAIGRLTGQSEEQKLLGKAHGRRGIEGLTVGSALSGDESIKSNGILAELTQGRGAGSLEKQSLMANSAVSAEESAAKAAKTAVDKAKNRSSAENGAQNGLIAGQNLRTEAKKPAGEREGISRAEEVRKEKKRSTMFEVRDFRSTPAAAESVSVRAGGEARVSGEAAGKDIVLEVRLPQHDPSAAKTSWEVKAGQAFEDILARELHQNLNNDIVRHASVALRDGNEGTIRLALKPESLGNVKIHLEMAENKITGRIVVETMEALRAFEREIASLEKAFQDSGFEGANLEMSLADHGRGAEQQWQGTEASQFLPDYYAASRYDAAFESMEVPLTLDVYQQGTRAINLLA